MYDKERFEEIVNIQIAVLEERIEMEFKELFPIWNQLTKEEQERLEQGVTRRICKKGTILHVRLSTI